MNSRRAALFDGIEEGGIRASSSYSSHEIDEHENERALDGLQDRVNLLKRLSGDINEEVDNHNHVLDRMGNDMDASRGFLSGTMDKFKMVFETKSSRRMFTLVASFVVLFLIVYYLTSNLEDPRTLDCVLIMGGRIEVPVVEILGLRDEILWEEQYGHLAELPVGSAIGVCLP